MQIGQETVELITVRKGDKDSKDTALVAAHQVKEFEARGYKVVKAEAPKPPDA